MKTSPSPASHQIPEPHRSDLDLTKVMQSGPKATGRSVEVGAISPLWSRWNTTSYPCIRPLPQFQQIIHDEIKFDDDKSAGAKRKSPTLKEEQSAWGHIAWFPLGVESFSLFQTGTRGLFNTVVLPGGDETSKASRSTAVPHHGEKSLPSLLPSRQMLVAFPRMLAKVGKWRLAEQILYRLEKVDGYRHSP